MCCVETAQEAGSTWMHACRLTGGRSGAGLGFAGTLYDGGYVLADARDRVHTITASQAGACPHPASL